MPETVIKVENLSKRYRLGTIGGKTLREDVQRWWAKLRGKPDPLLKIGEEDRGNITGENLWALRDVSFEVKRGEILGIIGRNGAGKSTLLKIISQITAPTSGEIKIKGRIGSLLEVGTGFHPELTGRENTYLNGAILGMSKQEVDKKFDEIVDFAEIEKFIDTPVKRYSSGMYVRLAFAVAAHLDPEILVVDEVLAVGDIAFQKKCLGKMSLIGKAGRTVIFVSHNMASINHLCGKALLLKNGKLERNGETESIVSLYLEESKNKTKQNPSLSNGFIYQRQDDKKVKECEILSVELLSKNNKRIVSLRTWDEVKFRLNYLSRIKLKNVSFALRLETIDGAPLLHCSTQPDSNVQMDIAPGKNFIDCNFYKWPLSKGEYVLGIRIAIPKTRFIWKEDSLCTLKVDEKDVFKTGSPPDSKRYLVAVDYSWTIPK